MLTPQQVMEAYAKDDIDVMMDAVRQVSSRQPQPTIITSPANYVAHIIHDLGIKTREEFWVTTLNNAHEIIRTHPMYVGTIYTAVMRLGEVMRTVIMDDATTFIVAHNHPGAQRGIRPSPEDVHTTKNLYKAGLLLGIPLMDHVIVSNGQWFSLSEHNMLKENNNVRTNQAQRPTNIPGANGQGAQRAPNRRG